MGDAERSALEAVIAAKNGFAAWSQIAVAAGLIIELVVLFAFAKEMRWLEKGLLIVANVVIIGGVWGEYHFGGQAAEAAAKLQQASDREVADMSAHMADANRDAAEARKDAAEATERAAKAEKQTEDERVERLKLQAKFSWRHLTDDQILSVISALLPFQHLPYDREIADAESLSLLSDIAKILTSPNLQWVAKQDGGRISLRDGNGVTIGIWYGTDISITYGATRESDFGPAAKTLASALVAQGVAARVGIEATEPETIPDQRIHIKIGSKPAY